MVANRMETPKGEEQGDKAGQPAATAAAVSGGGQSGIKAWIPLLVAVVAMPVMAYAVTTFVLVPKLQKSLGVAPAAPAVAEKHGEESSGGKEEHGGGKSGGSEAASGERVQLTKLLVNVAGTMGSRYLLTSLTLVGSSSDFRGKVERYDPQLRDLALGLLSTKTITDIEKPGARNLIRSELISGFNHILGGGAVQEIYITEFAIQ
jgi:flagellar protein FliL